MQVTAILASPTFQGQGQCKVMMYALAWRGENGQLAPRKSARMWITAEAATVEEAKCLCASFRAGPFALTLTNDPGDMYRLVDHSPCTDVELEAVAAEITARRSRVTPRPPEVSVAGLGVVAFDRIGYACRRQTPSGSSYLLRLVLAPGDGVEDLGDAAGVISFFDAHEEQFLAHARAGALELWNDSWRTTTDDLVHKAAEAVGLSLAKRDRARVDRTVQLKSLVWETDAPSDMKVRYAAGDLFGGHDVCVPIKSGEPRPLQLD